MPRSVFWGSTDSTKPDLGWTLLSTRLVIGECITKQGTQNKNFGPGLRTVLTKGLVSSVAQARKEVSWSLFLNTQRIQNVRHYDHSEDSHYIYFFSQLFLNRKRLQSKLMLFTMFQIQHSLWIRLSIAFLEAKVQWHNKYEKITWHLHWTICTKRYLQGLEGPQWLKE